jgi:signal transduction histidine kinase
VTERSIDRLASALFWMTVVLGVVSVAIIPVGAGVTFGGGDRSSLWSGLGFGFLAAGSAAGIAWLGMLMVRRARNVIGWAFLAMAFAAVVSLAADAGIQLWARQVGSVQQPGAELLGWLDNLALLCIALPIPAIFLLFPTGRPLSDRWRWALRLWCICVPVALVWGAFRPGEVYGAPPPNRIAIENPIGIGAAHAIFPTLATVAGFGALAAGALGVASLVVRFRRSRGEERAQMRWLAFAALLAAIVLVSEFAVVLIFGERSPVSDTVGSYGYAVLVLVLLLGIPASVAIAILKYRLYDLDVVIRKTIVFGILAAFITIVYVGIVAGIGSIVGATSSTATSFLAAAVLAVLFQPARDRAKRLADRLVYGARATPYEVLSEFSDRIGGAYASDDVLGRMAEVLATGTGAEVATVWLRVGGELRPTAVWPEDTAPEPSDHVEVRHRGELLGELSVRMPASDTMNPAKEKLVRDLAAQAGLVLRNERLIEDLRASRQRLVAAQDGERRRIERNIHDGAQQQLVALAVKQRLVASVVGRDDERARAMLEELQAETTQALDDLRDLARGIYPPLLADRGLGAALDAQARKSPVPVAVAGDGIGRLAQDVEAAVYFSCLEALQNVGKYANASSASIRVAREGEMLTFEIEDDGDGFDPSATGYGTGLQGIADRLDALGGRVEVRSSPGHGTTISGVLPVAAPDGRV